MRCLRTVSLDNFEAQRPRGSVTAHGQLERGTKYSTVTSARYSFFRINFADGKIPICVVQWRQGQVQVIPSGNGQTEARIDV
jgi:hypothetical protein